MIKVRLLQQLPIYIIELDLCSLTERDVTQIFPLSLYKLLALNDQAQQFSTELDGIRMCHGCGKKAASLQRCLRRERREEERDSYEDNISLSGPSYVSHWK